DNVTTSRHDHMREFRSAWKSFRGKKEKQMTDSERVLFHNLQTEPQREAFLLCRSFATLKKEFPLSQSSLADRIGVTQQGAGYVIARLIKVGAIKRTANAKTNRKSAYYRWNPHLLGDPHKGGKPTLWLSLAPIPPFQPKGSNVAGALSVTNSD